MLSDVSKYTECILVLFSVGMQVHCCLDLENAISPHKYIYTTLSHFVIQSKLSCISL